MVCRELDRVRVKGRAQPVTLFEPLGPVDALTDALREELALHEQALLAYRVGDWELAAARFEALRIRQPERVLYTLYLERIAVLRADPPAAWDGVFTLAEK